MRGREKGWERGRKVSKGKKGDREEEGGRIETRKKEWKEEGNGGRI